MEDAYETKVAMAKRLAKTWLEREALPEFRFVVYSGASEQIGNIPGLLRGFRDGKTTLEGVPQISDLGVAATPDKITFSSRDKESLELLEGWLRSKGCESSGVL